jgi:hypothetical protein
MKGVGNPKEPNKGRLTASLLPGSGHSHTSKNQQCCRGSISHHWFAPGKTMTPMNCTLRCHFLCITDLLIRRVALLSDSWNDLRSPLCFSLPLFCKVLPCLSKGKWSDQLIWSETDTTGFRKIPSQSRHLKTKLVHSLGSGKHFWMGRVLCTVFWFLWKKEVRGLWGRMYTLFGIS